jgi:hypothetical protein
MEGRADAGILIRTVSTSAIHYDKLIVVDGLGL